MLAPHNLRTKRRMAELETQRAEADDQLRRHIAAAPLERADNAGLLDRLPQVQVDLNTLAADRLRRFLDAFRVEIHYDIRSGRATFRAEISGDMIDQLVLQIRRAEAAGSIHGRPAHKQDETNETGPAQSGGSARHRRALLLRQDTAAGRPV